MFRVLTTAVSRQQLLLATGDVVCILLALVASNLAYVGPQYGGARLIEHLIFLTWPSLFIVVVHVFFFYLADVYNLRQDLLSMRYFAALMLAIGLSVPFLGVCFFLFPSVKYGRAAMLIHVAFLILFVVVWRNVFVKLTKTLRGGRRVLLVGIESCTVDIAKELQAPQAASFRLAGYLPVNGEEHPKEMEGIRALGEPRDIARIVREHDIQEIVLAPSAERQGPLVRSLVQLGYQGVPIVDAVSFYERLTGRIPFDHLTDIWILTHSLGNIWYLQWRVKRLMDILFSTIGLALGAIPIGLAMIAIKLTSPGPVFFRQERTGRNGVPFTLVKLRTMIPNAEQKTGAVYTEKEDPRITPVGRFLRKTRIDEIPQLWNVLKGEMSLIGPRPERREFVEQFERAIPYYAERLAVRPGITGWAQVKYPYASNLEETKQKLQYDLYYIKNMSLVLDFVVILMTIKTILFAKGQ